MAASQSTQYYNLPIYEPDDTTSYLTDFNGAMEKIDAAIHAAAQGGGGGGSTINVVQTTGNSETDVMSQKAVTEALADKADVDNIPDVPNVVQTTGTSETDVMSQKAVTQALTNGEWNNPVALTSNNFGSTIYAQTNKSGTKCHLYSNTKLSNVSSNPNSMTYSVTDPDILQFFQSLTPNTGSSFYETFGGHMINPNLVTTGTNQYDSSDLSININTGQITIGFVYSFNSSTPIHYLDTVIYT